MHFTGNVSTCPVFEKNILMLTAGEITKYFCVNLKINKNVKIIVLFVCVYFICFTLAAQVTAERKEEK